ncbi:MAG: response regulator [Candidatus Omnitrophota bacterium]
MDKKILIIDDEPDFTDLIRMAFDRVGGYEVRALNNPLEAVEAIKEFRPDIVLLDIMMPDMDGSEVAERIREDAAISGTRIIFLTGTVARAHIGSPDSMIGGHVFISKPVNIRELVNCVQKHIG